MEHDPWLSPTRQFDLPGRAQLPTATLQGRREATFLVLAAMFLVAAAALVLLGARTLFDVNATVAPLAADRELPAALVLPIGALALPVGWLAITLVGALYGRRRAIALVLVGSFSTLALIGLLRAAELETEIAAALALAGGFIATSVLHVLIFAALRRQNSWLRATLATLIGQPVGWAVFGLALIGLSDGTPIDQIRALMYGGAAYTIACGVIAALPVVLIVKLLRGYLRVGRNVDQRPAAIIVEEAVPEPAMLAADRSGVSRGAAIAPYSSAEMRFFTEGDQLAEAAD
jgi:uncharacterized PurR-regulated membrane protein YhhQ (DUF165 family)